MKSTTSDRATSLLYRLHNSGRFVSVSRMQRIANIAAAAGSRETLVRCYTNGNTNGR